MTRRCSRCKLELPLDDFGGHARRPLGKSSVCKPCAAKLRVAYRSTPTGQLNNRLAAQRSRARSKAARALALESAGN